MVPDLIRIKLRIVKQDPDDIARDKTAVDALSAKAAAALTANGVRTQDIFSSSMGIHVAQRYDEHNNAVPAGHIASREIDLIVRNVEPYPAVV